MIALGIMSGSSLDGLDLAMVRFEDATHYSILASATAAIPESLTKRLRNCTDLTAIEYLTLDKDYGLYIAQEVQAFLDTHHHTIDVIGLHGHTVVHKPNEGLTTQLGHGGVVAARTGIDVVTDFRIQDVTKGGIGTPLVSIVDLQLLSGYTHFINLGGIANITHINDGKISAYDICPCNQVLNYVTTSVLGLPYDADGNISRKGNIIAGYTTRLDSLPYWNQPGPKSLDNGFIKDEILKQLDLSHAAADLLCTLTHWVAEKIATEVGPSAQVLVTGGGTYHRYLIDILREKLAEKDSQLVIPERHLIDYKESLLMAYLAYLRLSDQHNILHGVTHATTSTIAGAHYKSDTP